MKENKKIRITRLGKHSPEEEICSGDSKGISVVERGEKSVGPHRVKDKIRTCRAEENQ